MARISDLRNQGQASADKDSAAGRVVDSETLDASLAETIDGFLKAAQTAGDELLAKRADANPPTRRSKGVERDQLRRDTFTAIRGYLGDELTVVARLQGENGIADSDRLRDIAKGALATLKKPELQRAAAHLKLSKGGSKSQLLDRLVDRVGPDPHEIAELIAHIDRAPREGRRHAARLFAFDEAFDTAEVVATLGEYSGRYVRTALARWFVLETVGLADGVAIADGRLRTYDIDVRPDTLDAHERNYSVQLQLFPQEPLLHSYSRLEAESIAAVEAFALFVEQLPLTPLGRIGRQQPLWGRAAGVDLQSAWLVGVLLSLLQDPQMTLQDVTSASFEKSSRGGAVGVGAPYVGSARLRGQHVLDSQSACKHLAANERLSAVTAMVKFVGDDGGQVSLPVRISVEPTHVAVMTGFGEAGIERSRALHRALEDHVGAQMVAATFDVERLEDVLGQMLERANAIEAPKFADLFALASAGEVQLDADSR